MRVVSMKAVGPGRTITNAVDEVDEDARKRRVKGDRNGRMARPSYNNRRRCNNRLTVSEDSEFPARHDDAAGIESIFFIAHFVVAQARCP